MRKSDVSTFARTQVRAYFIWLNEFHDCEKCQPDASLRAWLAAELIELGLAAKRSAAARKGAATRRAAKAALPQATLQVHADGTSTRLAIH